MIVRSGDSIDPYWADIAAEEIFPFVEGDRHKIQMPHHRMILFRLIAGFGNKEKDTHSPK